MALAGSSCWAAAKPDFYSHYWVQGVVSVDALPAANRRVDLYYRDANIKASAVTDSRGYYRLNAYDLQYFFGVPLTLETQSYNVVPAPLPGDSATTPVSVFLTAVRGYIDVLFPLAGGFKVPPSIYSFWPDKSKGDVAPTSPTVTIVFTKTMEVTSIPRAVILPSVNNGWQMQYSPDQSTFYFTPGSFLTAEVNYTVTITRAASDESGNSLDDKYTYSFKPSGGTHPHVVKSNPADGQKNVPRLSNCSFLFSEGMNKASVSQALGLPSQGAPWIISWGSQPGTGNTVTCTPQHALDGDTDYTMTVSAAALNLSGEALSPPYKAVFHTTNQFVGPEVINVIAGNDVPPASPIWVIFSEPIAPNTLPANMDLRDNAGKLVSGRFSWDSSSSTANFIPDSPLKPLQEYTVNIRTGITDLAGYHLKKNVSSLIIIADTTGPTISHVWFDGRGFVDNDIISPTAQITAEISDPSGLDYSAMTMNVGNVRMISRNSFRSLDAYSGNRLVYKIWPSLPEGSYTMTIEAYDLRGNASDWQGRVRVFSGETQIVPGTIPFASPASFSPLKAAAAGGEQVTMVYQLTTPGNIDLQIQGITGMAWARRYAANSMGGYAGYNAVAWDGKDSGGMSVANGVYTFRIINNGRLLGKGFIIVFQ